MIKERIYLLDTWTDADIEELHRKLDEINKDWTSDNGEVN